MLSKGANGNGADEKSKHQHQQQQQQQQQQQPRLIEPLLTADHELVAQGGMREGGKRPLVDDTTGRSVGVGFAIVGAGVSVYGALLSLATSLA